MLAVSGVVTGLLLVEFYRQSTNAQVGRAEETVARACRQLADSYQFFVTGWRGGGIDDALKQQLVTVVQTALRQSPGVEGGICIQCRAVSGLEWRKGFTTFDCLRIRYLT